jgi:uncharacterized protein
MQMATPFEPVAKRTWWATITGLILTLGVASLPIGDWDHELANVAHLVGNEAIWWTYVIVVLLYVRCVEKRPLSSIGFRKLDIKSAIIGIASGIMAISLLGTMYFVVLPALHLYDNAGGTPTGNALLATPFWWRFISTVRAAVSEEILFRGYAMERIQELTASRTLAVLLPCTIFTLDHVPAWGWSHELIVAVAGLGFSLLYLWRRNLLVNIIAHFMVDAISVLA